MYDLIIIGGGPAAIAAGIYAARKRIRTLFITEAFGGQSVVSQDIQNWVGTISISGFDLAKSLENHLRAQEGIEIVDGEVVARVVADGDGYLVTTEGGTTHQATAIVVATGSKRRKLGIPGEEKYDGKGVAYCSTCDAPLFKDKVVAVVGGGNAGVEAVLDLAKYAKEVYLFEYSDVLKADLVTQERAKATGVKIVFNADVKEIIGNHDKAFVGAMKYIDLKNDTEKKLVVDGVFVEIGMVPNSQLVSELVHVSGHGEIVVEKDTCKTSREGIFAAGDVTDVVFKQNNIAAGDGVRAALSAHEYLQAKNKEI